MMQDTKVVAARNRNAKEMTRTAVLLDFERKGKGKENPTRR
jgi:hypothetical protein